MKLKTKEADVLKSCLQYLKYKQGYFWRNQTGALSADNRFVRFGHKGSADILGVRKIADGICQFVAIECKSSTGKQSADQKMFQYEIEKQCGLYVLAFSVDDLIKAGI